MSPLTLETLLDLLGPDRRPVAEIWKALGVERKKLERFIAEHYDALAEAGMKPHDSTTSQASSPRLYVTINGKRVAALSLPVVEALAVVEPAPLAARAGAVDLAAAAWLDSKGGRSGSTRTRDSYGATLGDARAALVAVGLDLDSDPRAVALALQGWSRGSKRPGVEVKPSTVAHRLAVVSSFYAFVLRRGLLPGLTSNPADLVERPRVESYADVQALDPGKVRRALDELRKAAAAGDDAAARDLALLRVALVTGRRVAELAALRWRDAEITDGAQRITLTFRRAKGGKVKRDALAPSVTAELLHWLHRHYGAALGALAPDAPLWPSAQPNQHGPAGGPMSERGIRAMVQARLGAHPHQLRHTFSHDMRRAGAKDSEVQVRLGHSSLATTGRYLAQLEQADNPYGERLAGFYDPEE